MVEKKEVSKLAGWFSGMGKPHRSKWMMTAGTPMTLETPSHRALGKICGAMSVFATYSTGNGWKLNTWKWLRINVHPFPSISIPTFHKISWFLAVFCLWTWPQLHVSPAKKVMSMGFPWSSCASSGYGAFLSHGGTPKTSISRWDFPQPTIFGG